MAKIQLNGDPYEINYGTNLNDLLNKLKIQKNKVAVEVNGQIVENPEAIAEIVLKHPNLLVITDMNATVSGPISSGLLNGISP